VVGEDLDWIRGTKEDVMPHAESFYNGQKFVIIDKIIPFGRRKFSRMK
jgi:hypothetical protein